MCHDMSHNTSRVPTLRSGSDVAMVVTAMVRPWSRAYSRVNATSIATPTTPATATVRLLSASASTATPANKANHAPRVIVNSSAANSATRIASNKRRPRPMRGVADIAVCSTII
jgi:hypothetical protein